MDDCTDAGGSVTPSRTCSVFVSRVLFSDHQTRFRCNEAVVLRIQGDMVNSFGPKMPHEHGDNDRSEIHLPPTQSRIESGTVQH